MEIKPKNDGAKDENDETTNITDDSVEADIASENRAIESKDETDRSEDESIEMPDATYESKDENVGISEDNNKQKEEKTNHNDIPSQNGNAQTVRRSERKHIQRFPIDQDDIGECDDRNNKDYK